jgi:hypothetical protein
MARFKAEGENARKAEGEKAVHLLFALRVLECCGPGGSRRDLKRCRLTTSGHEIASLPNATANCFISNTSFASFRFHFSY